MATYWENSCSFGLRYVSWYKCLIVSLVFSHLGFWSGDLFLIAPLPDLCLLVPFSVFRDIPNSLKNEKMIIQKSLHPQFGNCMAKQHNIAKYSRKVILSCDKRRFYPWIVLEMDLRCGLLLYLSLSHYD